MISRWIYNKTILSKTTGIAKQFKQVYLSNTNVSPEQVLQEVISLRYRTSVKTLFRSNYLDLLGSANDDGYFDGLYQFVFAIIFMEDQAISYSELSKLHEDIGSKVRENIMKVGFGPEQLGDSTSLNRDIYQIIDF